MRGGLMNNFLFFLIISFSVGQFGLNKQVKTEAVDGVAAVVENSVILKSDVIQQAFVVAQQQGIDPNVQPTAFEDIYINTLKQMVDNLVLYEVSLKDTNIVVDPLMVEESMGVELKRRIEYAGSAKKLEELFGEPLSMIRSKLRQEIKKAIRVESFTGKIYQSVKPSFNDVKTFYNAFIDSLPMVSESVDFSVLEWPIDISEQKEERVKFFLDSLKSRYLEGESFYDLASVYSEDTGSASNGGRLGFFVRGSLFPEYEEVAFSLEPGTVSEPFKSSAGYHIVLLEDRVGEKIKTSHILKRVDLEEKDVELSKKSLVRFLGEHDVYNSVSKFDSLCTHYPSGSGSFHGVFPKSPISSLPKFVDPSSFYVEGFKDFVEFGGSLFVVRVWGYAPERKMSLSDDFSDLLLLTKNKMINDKLVELINKEKENLYVEKFY